MKLKHVTNNVYYLIFYRKNIRIPVVCNKKYVSVLNENMHDGQPNKIYFGRYIILICNFL